MFGLQLPHAVWMEEVIEGDAEEILEGVTEVSLPTETGERLDWTVRLCVSVSQSVYSRHN